MNLPLLPSVVAMLSFLVSGCTEHTVVYRIQPTSVQSSSSSSGGGDSRPPLTLPGTPVAARDGGALQNFDAQSK